MFKRKAITPISSQQQVPPNPAATSEYKKFLHALPIRDNRGKSVGPAIKRGWQDVPQGSRGMIVNEIAQKFNISNPPIGINKVNYSNDPRKNSYYWVNAQGKTQMDLVPQHNVGQGPNPNIVGHELIHANDHQIDHLNPKVWEHLRTLASPMNSFEDLGHSIGKIQDKIDPTGAFKRDPAFPNSGYPIDQGYIKKDIEAARGNPYQTPTTNGNPNWPQLFNEIQEVVNPPNLAQGSLPNPGFYLNRASEFPAFMSENLTNRWRANEGPGALSVPEAQFLYSTLEDMDRAYPEETYPTMGQYNRARRNSLNAAYPNALISRMQPSGSSSSSNSQ